MTGSGAEPADVPGEPDKLRRRIAEEAARLLARGGDSERARYRAARRVGQGWVPPDQIPEHEEVRRELHRVADSRHGFAALVGDRFDRIAAAVAPLAAVRTDPTRHVEADALEHALQVFDLVHDERPFDEELLTAALVHDVGRAIDRADAIAAGLAALEGLVTPRTAWLVETLPVARAYRDGTLGQRARHRLAAHPDFEDVLLLADADRRAHVRNAATPALDEAIAMLRALAENEAADEA
jgi:hypothetical protein